MCCTQSRRQVSAPPLPGVPPGGRGVGAGATGSAGTRRHVVLTKGTAPSQAKKTEQRAVWSAVDDKRECIVPEHPGTSHTPQGHPPVHPQGGTPPREGVPETPTWGGYVKGGPVGIVHTFSAGNKTLAMRAWVAAHPKARWQAGFSDVAECVTNRCGEVPSFHIYCYLPLSFCSEQSDDSKDKLRLAESCCWTHPRCAHTSRVTG